MNKSIILQASRLDILDSMKGIAIIAVVLYHFGGILPYGYLGVDIFFVLGGYFFVRGLLIQFENNKFHYWKFVFHKIVRLWPLILMASVVSLICGFWTMLPDDYENLSESVIASVFFANNILQGITTRDYWNVVNQYKPLMHTWYVSVLMQAYIILPMIYIASIKIHKNVRKGILRCTSVLSLISIGLYLLPAFHSEWKFYYLPFRIFEFTIGGQLLFVNHKLSEKNRKMVSFIFLFVLLGMLCARKTVISQSVMLLVTVAAAAAFIFCVREEYFSVILNGKIQNILSEIGKRSYSIYIWHQVVIAFLFYSVFEQKSLQCLAVGILLIFLLSFLSYQFVERLLNKVVQNRGTESMVIAGNFVLCLIICSVSFQLYMHAGVVRDVPELGIDKDNVHRHMHAEYCDRPYGWDHDFAETDKVHILVLGNSFGRDWANVLCEYDTDDKIEISYSYYPDENFNEKYCRIEEADYVFYAIGPKYDGVPEEIIRCVPGEKLYIVGNKKYGESNGIIYARRYSENYFNQSVAVPGELLEQNAREAERWGGHYIDLLGLAQNPDSMVFVFTDDHKFISQDCTHLTQVGAQYYADLLKQIGSR